MLVVPCDLLKVVVPPNVLRYLANNFDLEFGLHRDYPLVNHTPYEIDMMRRTFFAACEWTVFGLDEFLLIAIRYNGTILINSHRPAIDDE